MTQINAYSGYCRRGGSSWRTVDIGQYDGCSSFTRSRTLLLIFVGGVDALRQLKQNNSTTTFDTSCAYIKVHTRLVAVNAAGVGEKVRVHGEGRSDRTVFHHVELDVLHALHTAGTKHQVKDQKNNEHTRPKATVDTSTVRCSSGAHLRRRG